MKKLYENAKIEFSAFDTSDVITVSVTVTAYDQSKEDGGTLADALNIG